jgi:DNA (cytosine-5)-methyltransferase 1
MDKSPLYVATAEQVPVVNVYVVESIQPKVTSVTQTKSGNLIYVISIYDSPFTKALKIFMAQNGIVDIKMRMLEIEELLRIQGFPDGYVLKGTKTNQKKFSGNSVVPLVAERLIEACVA